MGKALLALVDDAAMQSHIAAAAVSLGYSVDFFAPVDDVVRHLVGLQPWLIVVDLGASSFDWERLVTAIKTSPATRRIPILAFASSIDATILDRAYKAGCDAVVSAAEFRADTTGMIERHARIDQRKELLRQAQDPLPPLAHKAIEQFNRREFWEQHETFETVWRAEPGPVRQLYQGILQVGVAYYQIQRRNYDGARKLFLRAWQYLSALPDVCQTVDVARLRADAQAAQSELERLGPERVAEFDPAFFKPVHTVTINSTARC
jgi:predicted metal-dependent hydrolase